MNLLPFFPCNTIHSSYLICLIFIFLDEFACFNVHLLTILPDKLRCTKRTYVSSSSGNTASCSFVTKSP